MSVTNGTVIIIPHQCSHLELIQRRRALGPDHLKLRSAGEPPYTTLPLGMHIQKTTRGLGKIKSENDQHGDLYSHAGRKLDLIYFAKKKHFGIPQSWEAGSRFQFLRQLTPCHIALGFSPPSEALAAALCRPGENAGKTLIFDPSLIILIVIKRGGIIMKPQKS